MAVFAGRLVLMIHFYTLLVRIALPVVLLRYWWRYRSSDFSWKQLLSLGLKARSDRPLWLHAASMGEVQALSVLVRRLAQRGSVPLLVTVGTPTGLSRARELFAGMNQVDAQLAPLDLPGAARRFLDATQPRAVAFIETELWPNLVGSCRSRGLPLVLVSARLSARSLQRYQRWAQPLMRDVVCSFAQIASQSALDRERFIGLGADPSKVTIGGNLKFDLTLPADIAARGRSLRDAWAGTRPVWVAGSTHEGEEAICLAAQRELCERARSSGLAEPLLVLAPRRPERFTTVSRWLESQGLQFAPASRGPATDRRMQVLLLDATGVLLCWYAAADVAFVGGSLVPVGGHNLLEPAAMGKPVIAGPHCFNSPEPAQLLAESGALTTVADAAELVAALGMMLGDPRVAAERGARAAAVVEANRGAAERAADLLVALTSARY